jgi:hypothetical protein
VISGWSIGTIGLMLTLLEPFAVVAVIVLTVVGYATLRSRLIRIENTLQQMQRPDAPPRAPHDRG